MQQLVPFRLTDPVLCTDAATEADSDIMHDALQGRSLRQEFCGIRAAWLAQVEMDVAVADMSESNHPCPRRRCRDRACRGINELRDRADRHRNVVFETCAFPLLRLRNPVSDAPQVVALRVALRNSSVGYRTDLQRTPERRLEVSPAAALAVSISANQGDVALSGARHPSMWRSTYRRARSGISSNATS